MFNHCSSLSSSLSSFEISVSITCDLQTILDLQKVTFALTLMRI
ncbi:hypothetical protein AAZX31_10G154400 [Glycine max]